MKYTKILAIQVSRLPLSYLILFSLILPYAYNRIRGSISSGIAGPSRVYYDVAVPATAATLQLQLVI